MTNPLPDRSKYQIAEPREFRFGVDAPAIAAGILAILCVAGAIIMPLMPTSGPPAPVAFKIGIPAFFLFGALFMAYLALSRATRVLTLTDTSLTDRSLFGAREIPLDQVVSVTTKDMQTKSGTLEMTTVASDTTTISFPANLPDYGPLMQAIQAKVGAKVAANAPQAIAKDARKYVLQNVIGLAIIGTIMGLAWGGLWMTALHDGQAALTRQMELDAHGKTVNGEVTGVDKSNGKSISYSLSYSYQVDGKRYDHASTISQDTYEQEQVGSPVPVVYLPSDPEVSRAGVSIAKEKAQGKIQAAKGMIVFACVLPFLLPGLSLMQKPRYHTPPARPSIR